MKSMIKAFGKMISSLFISIGNLLKEIGVFLNTYFISPLGIYFYKIIIRPIKFLCYWSILYPLKLVYIYILKPSGIFLYEYLIKPVYNFFSIIFKWFYKEVVVNFFKFLNFIITKITKIIYKYIIYNIYLILKFIFYDLIYKYIVYYIIKFFSKVFFVIGYILKFIYDVLLRFIFTPLKKVLIILKKALEKILNSIEKGILKAVDTFVIFLIYIGKKIFIVFKFLYHCIIGGIVFIIAFIVFGIYASITGVIRILLDLKNVVKMPNNKVQIVFLNPYFIAKSTSENGDNKIDNLKENQKDLTIIFQIKKFTEILIFLLISLFMYPINIIILSVIILINSRRK